jgi:hypothetical protein
MSIYLHDWAGNWDSNTFTPEQSHQRLMCDFDIAESDLEGVDILLASYTYEDYSGYAYVLFRKGGEYYEVYGSHCSCYGLEGQWAPESITLDELSRRLSDEHYHAYSYEYRSELYTLVDTLTEASKS